MHWSAVAYYMQRVRHPAVVVITQRIKRIRDQLKSGIIVAAIAEHKLQLETTVVNRIEAVFKRSGIVSQVGEFKFACIVNNNRFCFLTGATSKEKYSNCRTKQY